MLLVFLPKPGECRMPALPCAWSGAARLHIAAGRKELGLDFIAAQTQALLSGGL